MADRIDRTNDDAPSGKLGASTNGHGIECFNTPLNSTTVFCDPYPPNLGGLDQPPPSQEDLLNELLEDVRQSRVEPPVPQAQQSSQADQEEDPPEEPSVLDVKRVKGLKLGWIDDYADLMTELTASPREFHQLAGLITVAAAIQRKAVLQMSFGDIHPNIYGCIIAMSTVYGKSTAINRPRQILRAALLENLLIAGHGSSEGLIKQLSITPSALMVRDEIGTLFGSDKVRYMKDYKQDLTALYDCFPYSRRLSNDEIKVERPYLNILGATTPARFYSNVSNIDWQDGLLPRWLFVMPEGEPDFDKVTGVFTRHHADRITALSQKLMEFESKKDTAFILDGNAFTIFQTWRTAGLKAAYNQKDDNAMAIVGRYATYALKFALILAAVNDSWGTITPNIMQTAIQLADNYKANVYRILSEGDKHRVDGSKLQKVFAVVKTKGFEKGVTTKGIMQTTNMSKTELEPCLEKLTEIGAVIKEKSGAGFRYRTTLSELPAKSWNNQ